MAPKARVAVECAGAGDAAVYECVAENEAQRVSVETQVGITEKHYRVTHLEGYKLPLT